MFDLLKADVMARFTVAESYFKASYKLKSSENFSRIAKGLAFVQMYAVYEYTVVTLVRSAVDAITAHRHPMKDLTPWLMALFLDPELRSLQDSPPKSAWEARLKLFNRVFSDNPASVNNTILPIDGSHFRSSQLKLIFRVFGIKRLPAPRKRHLGRVDEVVDARNAIAHGRETAENIGRNHTRADVLQAFRQMQSVCLCLIQAIKMHCADAKRHRRK